MILPRWWMVRAGDNNELIPQWIEKNVASIGWQALGNPLKYLSRDGLIQKAEKVYEDESPGARILWASQVWKFSHDIKIGDRVVTFAKDTREYLFGTVTKEYEYKPELINDHYPNIVGIKWDSKRISRDLFSQGAKNSLGGISTVFRVDNWESEFETLLLGNAIPALPELDIEDVSFNSDNFIQQARSMVEDAVDHLDPWQMQDLVGGLLRAMGYQVRVSPKGPDGGVDILAHRDAFGFEKPIIKVQVKHKNSTSGSSEIQQLLGATPIGESCIFVSTGGFSGPARNVAQQHGVKLLDITELTNLVMELYEQLPIETKALVPLKRFYVPF